MTTDLQYTMSSCSSHQRSTSTHPYSQAEEPQQSTTTLASSVGETKKTFLGRWRSAFRKEAMEILPEQDSPLSRFLWTVPPITNPLAIPPIQNEPMLQQQTWPGTSSDLDWETRALEALLHLSDLASIVLGVKGYQTSPLGPTTYSSIPLLSSTSFGIGETPINPVRRTGSHQSSVKQ